MNIPPLIQIKTHYGLYATAVVYLIGDYQLAFTALLILTIIDMVTGIYKGWYHNAIHSSRFRDKTKHYIGYGLVIVSLNQILLLAPYLEPLADFAIMMLAIGEIVSIMENLESVGVPMPTIVKTKFLEIAKSGRFKK